MKRRTINLIIFKNTKLSSPDVMLNLALKKILNYTHIKVDNNKKRISSIHILQRFTNRLVDFYNKNHFLKNIL